MSKVVRIDDIVREWILDHRTSKLMSVSDVINDLIKYKEENNE